MIDILNLQPTVISKNLKGKYVLFYGPPKIGKTSLAAQFPKSLLLAFEPVYNALVNQLVQPVLKWSDFKTILRQLRSEQAQGMFDTIIIDTADIAWDYCEKYVCAQAQPLADGSQPQVLGDIPYGKGYDACKKEYDSTFREIAMLGYGMVFISHEQLKRVKTEDGEEYQKFMPTLPDRPRLIVNRMVDIIGYLRAVKSQDEEGGTKRMMFMRDNTLFEAGTRFKYLVDRIELNYDNLVNAIHEAIDKQVNEEGVVASESFVNAYEDTNTRPFEEVMNEAKDLWGKLVAADQDRVKNELLPKINKIFGRAVKLSEVNAAQVDLLELVILEMKSMLQ